MSDDAVATIAVVQKNSREELRVALHEYRGHQLLDLRIFADFENCDGRRPTKKGVSIRINKVGELITALQLTKAEAERRGLLQDSAS